MRYFHDATPMRFFQWLVPACLLQVCGVLATPFPGEPDLQFYTRIQASAALPLSGGNIVVAGGNSHGATDGSCDLEVVVLNSEGGLVQAPWVFGGNASEIYDIDALGSGSFLVSGVRHRTGLSDQTLLAKLQPGGAVDPDFGTHLGLSGEIRESLVLDGGGVVISGFFTDPIRPALSGIARLNPDGTVDSEFRMSGGARWSAGPPGIASLNLLPDGRLLAGGEFNSFDGVDQFGLVRLLPTGELDKSFHSPLLPGSTVSAVALQRDGRILVSGLLNLEGLGRRVLIRLEKDGPVDSSFQIPSVGFLPTLRRMGLLVDAEGRILFSGAITSVNGVPARTMARLQPDGRVDLNFAPFARNIPLLLTTGASRLSLGQQGEIYQYFRSQAFSPFDSGLIRFYGGDPAPVPPIILTYPASYQNVEGGRAEFSVSAIGFPTPTLQWFSNGRAIPGATNPSLVIPALQQGHSGILTVEASNGLGVASQQIATLYVVPKSHTSGALDTSFRLGEPALDQVMSFDESGNGQLIFAGLVTLDQQTRVLRYGVDGVLDPTLWAALDPLPPSPAATAIVRALPDGGVLIGGRFRGVGGLPRTNLARLTSTGTLDPSFVDLGGASGAVTALLNLKDGRFCVAGSFTKIQGVSRSRLAILKSDGTADDSFTPPVFSSDAQILQLFQGADGGVIAAGRWSAVDGAPRAGLLKLGLTGKVDPLAYASLSVTSVVAAIYSDGRVVAAARAPGAGAVQTRLIRFLPDGRLDESFQIPSLINGGVFNLTVDLKQRVIASGFNTLSVDGIAFRPLLRFFQDGRLDSSFSRDSEAAATQANSTRFMKTIADGRLAMIQGNQFALRLSEEVVAQPPTQAAPFVNRGAIWGRSTALAAPVNGENLRFSWYLNGQLTDQNRSVYAIPSFSQADVGEYVFVASNDFGAITSAPARLFPLMAAPTLGIGPGSALVAFPGQDVLLSTTPVSGSSPFRLQWLHNDQPLRGATTPELWLPAVEVTDSGYYQLMVGNESGEAHGVLSVLSVLSECFLQEALDAPDLRWVSDDPTLWNAVVDDTSDGVDAVRVGPLTRNLSPWLQTRVVGPGTLTFRWKLGAPEARSTFLFAISSGPGAASLTTARTRTVAGWEAVSVEVPAGVRYPTWVFQRGSSAGATLSSGSLDEVSFTPKAPTAPTIAKQPEGVTVSPGKSLRLFVSFQSQLPVQIQWFHNHALIPGAERSLFELLTAKAEDSGEYEARVTNAQGSVTSLPATVFVTDLPTPLRGWTVIPNQGLEFALPQEPDRGYRLQSSDDLQEWLDVDGWIPAFSKGPLRVLDPRGTTSSHRFYRAILE